MFRTYIDSNDNVHVIALRKRPDKMWVAVRYDQGRGIYGNDMANAALIISWIGEFTK